MPFVFSANPTALNGQQLFAPLSPLGSLADVFARVERGDPPAIWN
jgi:hypothetical protein